MSYIDKINKLMDGVDLGEPEFRVGVHKTVIRINDPSFEYSFDMGTFYGTILEGNLFRAFDRNSEEFILDRQRTIDRITYQMKTEIQTMFIAVSPAKEPIRTKAYKQLSAILDENRGKMDFMDSLFDIAEYYFNVTRTESIKSTSNDVHRKNIFQLLCLMEKRYGKTETNSNG